MAPDGRHHHRSTLKQKNKTFKARHSTKSSIKKLAKGRPASVTSNTSSTTTAKSLNGNGISRKNHAKQMQLAKREQLKKVEELFVKKGLPKIVSILELTPDGDAWGICKTLEAHKAVEAVEGHDVATVLKEGRESCRMRVQRPSSTLQFLPLPYGSLYPSLSAVASSDFVILLLSPSQSIEEGSWGELALRILHAQGMPEILAVVPTLSEGTHAEKTSVRKSLISFIKYFSPGTEKVHAIDAEAERDGLLRTLATTVPRYPSWREARPYLISEEAEWKQGNQDGKGTLIVKGWTRGNAQFSAQRLVHVRDFGDFRLKRIADLGQSIKPRKQNSATAAAMDVDMAAAGLEEYPTLEERDDEEADDLQSENVISEGDFGANEQTWPTEEEVAEGEQRQVALEKQKAPEDKYKTRWLIEDDDDEEGDDEGGLELEEEEGLPDLDDDFPIAGPSRKAMNGVGTPSEYGNDDEDDGYGEEDDGLSDDDAALFHESQQRQERSRRAAEDLQFPDEVDTPLYTPAKQRFARYRGLASLRSSTWDAYEELPPEYSKIYQFEDWDRIKRAVEGRARLEGVQTGQLVALELEDVPLEMARRFGALKERDTRLLPMTVWGLLRHEHKKTVMNLSVLRNTEYTETVKSKDPVLLLMGPRLLRVNPIYSEHSLVSSSSSARPSGEDGGVHVHPHKFFRFLPPPTPAPSVATVYAPITFGSPSATFLQPRSWGMDDGERGYDERGVGATQYPSLIGSGSLLRKNGGGPLRVNVKRVVLTGEPFKIHRRTATIRWMFFQPEDVRYFKPIPLRTKYGRTGHISEPLGTHGRYKAHFDGPIGQMDTIMMGLYKRVYPRYTTEQYMLGNEELPVKFVEGTEGRDVSVEGEGGQVTEMEI